mmetsp:Transcript_126385/g.252557  ORF Transcript_126385/g.252557 Transcript_126385/m.252557 type:complete len:518 (-) Transcript_126385:145-1698(-)
MASSGTGGLFEDADSGRASPQQPHCRRAWEEDPRSTSAAEARSEENEVEEEQEDVPGGALVPASEQPLGAEEGNRGETLRWWRLVWCHERCHKQETEPLRKAINEAAREVGAVLVCMKKANKFGLWLDHAQRPPFALLTDWREVKPCLQTISLQPPSNRPACTMVLCTMGPQFERAAAWAQTLPPRTDPVMVCRDLSSPKELLAIFASHLEGAGLSQDSILIQNPRSAPRGQPRTQADRGATRRTSDARRRYSKQLVAAAAAAGASDEAPSKNEAAQERDAQQNLSPFPTDVAQVPVLGSASASGTTVVAPSTGHSHHMRPSQPSSSSQVRHGPPAASHAAPTSMTPKAAAPDAASVNYSPYTHKSWAELASTPASSSSGTMTPNMSPYGAVGVRPEFSPVATDITMHSSNSSGALPMTPQERRTPVTPKAWIKRGRKSVASTASTEATAEQRTVVAETPPELHSQHMSQSNQEQVLRGGVPHPSHVQVVMSTICSQQSPEQVLSMLQRAMPDRYDD